MIRHHAPDELLLDYAAGVLPEGPALAVALHVALDPGVAAAGASAARRWAARCSTGSPALPTWARRRSRRRWRGSTICRTTTSRSRRPAVAAGLRLGARGSCGRIWRARRWRRAFGGFEEMRLDLHGDAHRVVAAAARARARPAAASPCRRRVHGRAAGRLHRQHRQLPRRRFRGRPGAQQHEPIADPGDPCIALIVLEKPIVLTGFWGRLFNPLLRRGWM